MPSSCDSVTVIYRQLPLVAQIIRDETWLEGERRGRAVSADDPIVRANVCEVVLRVGADMRRQAMAAPPQKILTQV